MWLGELHVVTVTKLSRFDSYYSVELGWLKRFLDLAEPELLLTAKKYLTNQAGQFRSFSMLQRIS